MYQTLSNPIVIIKNDDNERKAKLFSKSFKDDNGEIKGALSAVVVIDGVNVAISTHRRDINNILNKIKKPADLLYEKQTSGVAGTAGS